MEDTLYVARELTITWVTRQDVNVKPEAVAEAFKKIHTGIKDANKN